LKRPLGFTDLGFCLPQDVLVLSYSANHARSLEHLALGLHSPVNILDLLVQIGSLLCHDSDDMSQKE
jgi:hypothetical protein